MASEDGNPWLLLVVSLPTEGATARMRIWRALKTQGCMALRDGAYLLPAGDEREQALQQLADECIREGGNAWLMAVQPRSLDEEAAYRQLFDRSADYAELRKSWKHANRTLGTLAAPELANQPETVAYRVERSISEAQTMFMRIRPVYVP